MAENNAVLKLLYTDLGYKQQSISEDVQALIQSKLDAADERLMEDGIDPTSSSPHMTDLRVMYAAYLYRQRMSEKPMPKSLRLALNDAKVSAATGRDGKA